MAQAVMVVEGTAVDTVVVKVATVVVKVAMAVSFLAPLRIAIYGIRY